MKTILFIVPVPRKISPSARFRIELYEHALRSNGFKFTYNYFWDGPSSKVLYKEGKIFTKIKGAIKGFWYRIKTIFEIHKYDFIFILRETTPVGPPFFEWFYSRILKKKIIYDFDDAIWVNRALGNNAWVRFFKCYWKIKSICRWSKTVSVGNRFLYDYAKKFNSNVIINPTCVDTVHRHSVLKVQKTEKIVIGWTGSFSQLPCLNEVLDVLIKLDQKYDFEFLVIADKNPMLPLKNYKFLAWNEETEITDLLTMNIGIMPLPNDEFSQGKCGFKLIQFMALGIPVVATPIGVNKEIVDDNLNGFLCNTHREWYTALEKLLTNEQLRIEAGTNGREKIVQQYSLQSNQQNYLSLFQ